MQEYTVKEWEERFDELFLRVENGEAIGIYDEITGHRAVMMPIDDTETLLSLLDEASPPE